MISYIPGSVVLYREPGSSLPLWPSIYCTDDVAPRPFLLTRPPGYCSLVLRLTGVMDAYQLRWATTNDLNHFDPFAADENVKQSTPGLADAYRIALEALDSGLGLDHWKAVISNHGHEAILIDSDEDEGSDLDEEMRLAIERSLADVRAPEAERFLKSSNSQTWRADAWPVPHTWTDSLERARSTSSPLAEDEYLLPLRRRIRDSLNQITPTPSSSPKSSKRRYSPCPGYSEDDLPSPPRRRRLSAEAARLKVIDSPRSSAYESGKADPAGLSTSKLFFRNGIETSHNDIIEEDLRESDQFVQVFVGPEVRPEDDPDVDPERKQQRFQLMKCHVWERPYFNDALSGRNYFRLVGNNAWELEHPRLADIHPDDFKFVAEYLAGDDFGHRHPEGEEQVSETFAQCISAWRAAELLSMGDLLDHIVEKLRATREDWDLYNVMAFACTLYQTSDYQLEAHEMMKDLLTTYIAEYFFIYFDADDLRTEFSDRLKQSSDFRRDVMIKVAIPPERQQNYAPAEDGQADDESDDDMELYN